MAFRFNIAVFLLARRRENAQCRAGDLWIRGLRVARIAKASVVALRRTIFPHNSPAVFSGSSFRGAQSDIDKGFCRAYCLFVFVNGGLDPMAYFQLQPAEAQLQQLAEQYWQEAGARERELEKAAYEAGEAIRGGEHTLPNLEAIIRWKSERVVHYLIGNSNENIKSALAIAASPEAKTEDAVNALIGLRGVDISIASAILAAIYPERYAVLDYRALEALGHARHDVEFYAEYNAFCTRLAACGMVKPQDDLPAPTALHALERAFWQWSRSRGE
jgi:hypothetical protein